MSLSNNNIYDNNNGYGYNNGYDFDCDCDYNYNCNYNCDYNYDYDNGHVNNEENGHKDDDYGMSALTCTPNRHQSLPELEDHYGRMSLSSTILNPSRQGTNYVAVSFRFGSSRDQSYTPHLPPVLPLLTCTVFLQEHNKAIVTAEGNIKVRNEKWSGRWKLVTPT